jgi:formate dehydrogenase major subunit
MLMRLDWDVYGMGEGVMGLSRRGSLRAAGSAATGTALGGLLGVGADLGPATARAQELRTQEAKTTPSVCPYRAVGCATLVHTRGIGVVAIENQARI